MKNEVLTYYSNGKLLLSGEYFVLRGAKALAMPLNRGQHLQIARGTSDFKGIRWKSTFTNEYVFVALYEYPNLEIIHTNNLVTAEKLKSVLLKAKSLNPGFLLEHVPLNVTSSADFETSWGMGSSSSLVSNIAFWSDTDPFSLNSLVFGGSGYDIACARSDSPLLYRNENGTMEIKPVVFNPPFADSIYFIYTGKKENTRNNISGFRDKLKTITSDTIRLVSDLSVRMHQARYLDEFEVYMVNHEKLVSDLIGVIPVQLTTFADFPGQIKSLGAWGGDYIMATWKGSKSDLIHYFNQKNLFTIFALKEIILSN